MKIEICKLKEVAPGESRKIEVEGRAPIALFNVEGSLFCTDDTCTHGGASLTEDGYLLDETVECSWHGGTFDVRTGEPTGAPCTERLKTYKVEIENDTVYAVLE
ncbi:MAG TPA: non-heme iron oxygenase ferredoxin subunit [Burkholderiales bacterium]